MNVTDVYNQYPGILSNVEKIRSVDFPLFENTRRIYLDSAAASQEPLTVKQQMFRYRCQTIRGSNHSKNSAEAREAHRQYEDARKKLEDFFHAENYLVAFTAGTTDASNWTAIRFPFGRDDLLVLTNAEHNSQIVTTRNMAQKVGASIECVPDNPETGQVDLDKLSAAVNSHKKGKILLNLIHSSNVTGIVNPVKEIWQIIGERGFIYLDMAQTAGHIAIDLNEPDVDFAGISSHKMYGTMGMGLVPFLSIKRVVVTSQTVSAEEVLLNWFRTG